MLWALEINFANLEPRHIQMKIEIEGGEFYKVIGEQLFIPVLFSVSLLSAIMKALIFSGERWSIDIVGTSTLLSSRLARTRPCRG